jgi:hypothetical protein
MEDPAAVLISLARNDMNVVAYKPEPSARADTDEMRAAMFLASEKGIDYCDALDEVRRQYAEQQSRSTQ